jgi:hypothetical protein
VVSLFYNVNKLNAIIATQNTLSFSETDYESDNYEYVARI